MKMRSIEIGRIVVVQNMMWVGIDNENPTKRMPRRAKMSHKKRISLAGLGVLLGEAGLLIDPAPRLDAGPVLMGEAFRFVVDDVSIHKLM